MSLICVCCKFFLFGKVYVVIKLHVCVCICGYVDLLLLLLLLSLMMIIVQWNNQEENDSHAFHLSLSISFYFSHHSSRIFFTFIYWAPFQGTKCCTIFIATLKKNAHQSKKERSLSKNGITCQSFRETKCCDIFESKLFNSFCGDKLDSKSFTVIKRKMNKTNPLNRHS